ncbi:MAG: hypothetical protein A3C71_02305 [Candidatus Yanofskybacteria bacterium RIFCSPHIGHO2_02_FULL_43_15c]|uniref:Uncharacterized protein n=1 Tax=Candidatus Yanofskybacteria bacterium RIFCSPHIGHO2_02_FULL_43_15c TaxID=1802679 RepID=A0A1F8FGQ3_9BACT|nr:MAG: hypothetical protein A3C71_02305 [Candidatus Yanofskybacteria bacterium RIFCSPHIGHO2_02_FULL_43_15c]
MKNSAEAMRRTRVFLKGEYKKDNQRCSELEAQIEDLNRELSLLRNKDRIITTIIALVWVKNKAEGELIRQCADFCQPSEVITGIDTLTSKGVIELRYGDYCFTEKFKNFIE